MNSVTRTGLLESALDILRRAVSGTPYSSQAQLARATGESEANISRWLSGASTPTLRKLEPVLMALGVRFALPGDLSTGRNALLASPPKASARQCLPVAAADLPSAFALKVPNGDCSMVPTLSPGDTVIVDTLQRVPLRNGQIYLVRRPEDGSCLFRRLFLQTLDERSLLVLSPDNPAAGCEPLICAAPVQDGRSDDVVVGLVSGCLATLGFEAIPKACETQV